MKNQGTSNVTLAVVSSNIIEKNEKFLLVQEGHKHAYGLWDFRAGKLEEEITLTENAVKEAKEETGYRVKVQRLVGVYQKIQNGRNVVIFVFASSIVGGKLRTDYPDDEILGARWFTYEELKKMKDKLRDGYILDFIKLYRKKQPANKIFYINQLR